MPQPKWMCSVSSYFYNWTFWWNVNGTWVCELFASIRLSGTPRKWSPMVSGTQRHGQWALLWVGWWGSGTHRGQITIREGIVGVPRRKSTIRKERVKPHVLVLARGPEVRGEKWFQAWHGSWYLYSSLSSTLHGRECITLKELWHHATLLCHPSNRT